MLPANARSRPALRKAALIGLGAAAGAAAVVAAGGAASAAEHEGTIREAGTTSVVQDSYVVIFKNNPTIQSRGVDASARDLATKYGGKVSYTYRSALRGFAVKGLSEAQARKLAGRPEVDYVQKDGKVTINDTQTGATWGLDRIDQRNLPLDQTYTYPTTASNVHAYIIDTGIRFTHSEFALPGGGSRAVSGRDTVDNDNDATDCQGHGTHVSGTVGGKTYGVAKAVTLVGVRVLGCDGSGSTAGVAAGIDWVTANAIKPAVANMSLGGGVDATLDAAVQRSIASGVTYGIAAGNGNQFGTPQNACSTSPARVPEAITVGATQNNDQKASFSNFGTCLDIFAPGVGITSSWKDSDTATNTISGTSMATPHVVGVAALVASAHPGFTPQQVRDALVTSGTPGKVGNPGTGSPNVLLYVDNGSTPPPPPPGDFSLSVSPSAASTAPGGSVTATINTAASGSGTAPTITLSVTGAPAGATATLNPTSLTAGGSSKLTVTTSASTPAGTYSLTVTGTAGSTSHSATFALTVTGGGGGGCSGTSGTDVQIPDAGAAVTSPITISGCNRQASATTKVEVHIKHTYRGDLRIDLVAPDGSSYRLKSESAFDGADNVDATYTVNASTEAASGTWQLRVQDRYSIDTGYIDSWTLTV